MIKLLEHTIRNADSLSEAEEFMLAECEDQANLYNWEPGYTIKLKRHNCYGDEYDFVVLGQYKTKESR